MLSYIKGTNTGRLVPPIAAITMAKPVVAQDEGINGPAVGLRDADSRRICRKTDAAVLTVLVWVYFL